MLAKFLLSFTYSRFKSPIFSFFHIHKKLIISRSGKVFLAQKFCGKKSLVEKELNTKKLIKEPNFAPKSFKITVTSIQSGVLKQAVFVSF